MGRGVEKRGVEQKKEWNMRGRLKQRGELKDRDTFIIMRRRGG